MDWNLFLQIVTMVVGFISMLIVFLRKMDANFTKARAENTANYHAIDKRIHGVEVTVAPYAADLAKFKEKMDASIIKVTGLEASVKSLDSTTERLERELEALRNR